MAGVIQQRTQPLNVISFWRHLATTALLLVACSATASAQTPSKLIELPTAPRVDTSRSEVRQVYQLWRSYLSSKPDSIYDNPYWWEAEKKHYHDFDISRRWTYGYELASGRSAHEVFGLTPRVLSIQEEEKGLYAIRTLWAPEDPSTPYQIYSLQRVYAARENGQWKLRNALPILTEDWERSRVGVLRYIYPPGYEFDSKKAERSAAFIDSLEQRLDLSETEPITYYIGRDYAEMAKISGLDYAWDGNTGRAYYKNRQIFVGTSSERYPHEIAHVVVGGKYELAPLISEGLATYLGGFGKQSFQELVGPVAERVEEKGLTLEDMFSGRGVRPKTYYVGGAVLVKAAFEQGGSETLKRFLSTAGSESEVYDALSQVLSVDRSEANEWWKSKLMEYSRD